ncbi:MAG: zeta toxin family protein [Lentisphaeria bacterium]|jgi:predicted ABC-type ATPase|nr:zeta toxin family protein [Lentisphaeria bacterium]MDY0175360.1 zeta toxin family protein [Lentisphaeria bacterium]NLZ60856.1 AAA family ATPase [Lentisphaerota bacterium]
MQKKPTCYIIAGPNGAGKTTFAMQYLPKIAECLNFVNADEIAKGLSPLNMQAARIRAGRILLQIINEKIRLRENFAFETTLAGRTHLRRAKEWIKDGWRVELFYLWLPNADISAKRVEYRIKHGGHGIPPATVQRRYPRSLANLFEFGKVCSALHCLDNSEENIKTIFDMDKNGIQVYEPLIFEQMKRELA